MEGLSVLTENTLVPISLVIVFIGGVVWLTRLHSLATRNEVALFELANRVTGVERENNQIIERLAKIETKIDILIERKEV
jgi:hypothetical protein